MLSDTLDLPDRPDDAPTGSAFVANAIEQWERRPGAGVAHFTLLLRAREEAIAAEIMRGNVPSFCRTFHEVPLAAGSHTGSVFVLADYLPIGSDDDFIRVPLSPITATDLAGRLGCVLPTKRIVDAVYTCESARRQAAIPMPPPSPDMTSLERAMAHHEKIEAARMGDLGELLAGHKKDVVVTWRIPQTPNMVAIYGFFEANGKPFQPLQMPHPDWYSDYSHGIRLVREVMIVDGEERLVDDVLRDPVLHVLLTDPHVDPGPYAVTRYPVRAIPEEAMP
jgi:hypothetical protein